MSTRATMFGSSTLNRVAGVALALAAWEVGGRMMGDALFAPLSSVAVEWVGLVKEGRMLAELAVSLRQMLVGFLLACAVGMPLGVIMGRSDAADAIFHPWVSMFVVTSVAALVPLIVIVVGTSLAFRVTVVFLASVWYITLTTYQGARGIEPRFIDVGLSFAAGAGARFFKILLPALYPFLLTGARIGLIHAIRAMVVAEMFIITGYGGLIYNAGFSISSAPLEALLVTLMIIGVAADAVLRAIGRRVAPWYEERVDAGRGPG